MITKDNLKPILNTIQNDVTKAIKGPEQYIFLNVSFFNAGIVANIQNVDFNTGLDLQAEKEDPDGANHIFMHVDEFIQLIEE